MFIPRVYPILDTATLERWGGDLLTTAAAFLEGGAGILQLRHKAHWSRGMFENARQVARLAREAGVGQDDLTPEDARRLLGGAALLGFSSHNAAQLCAAAAEPVDYVALGPVFRTDSKSHPDPVVGAGELRRLRPLIERPLVAIGGITLENARSVWSAGADSVAVIAGLVPRQPGFHSLRQRMEEWQQLGRAV